MCLLPGKISKMQARRGTPAASQFRNSFHEREELETQLSFQSARSLLRQENHFPHIRSFISKIWHGHSQSDGNMCPNKATGVDITPEPPSDPEYSGDKQRGTSREGLNKQQPVNLCTGRYFSRTNIKSFRPWQDTVVVLGSCSPDLGC